MSRDDDTPRENHHSGEWPLWAETLVQEVRGMRKDLKGMTTDFQMHVGDDKVLKDRVDGLLERQKQADADARQLSIGTKLSVIAAIASPLAVILFEVFKH
jgi:hypothetical protein